MPARRLVRRDDVDGGQGEAVRVPQADGTLVPLPVGEDDALMPSLLTLSDVFGTGHHAALAAVGARRHRRGGRRRRRRPVRRDRRQRLGAEQIIILGRHEDRIALARSSAPPTSSRARQGGDRARARADRRPRRPLRPGVRRPRGVLRHRARDRAPRRRDRPRRRPQYAEPPAVAVPEQHHVSGGIAPARAYIEELLPDVLEGRLEPGRVFDRTALDEVPDGYRAMDEREPSRS